MDRQTAADTVMHGQSVVPHTYVSPEHPLYDPDARQYRFDPKAGSTLLERVGWIDDDGDPTTPRVAQGVEGVPDGTPLAFNLFTTSANMRQATTKILQTSLAECGVQLKLDYWSPGELFADGPDGPLFGRHFDLAQFAWLSEIEPSCELYLSSQIPTEENDWSGENNPGFANEAYDAACNGARQSLPGTPKYEAYHKEAQRIFAEQLPVVPLFMRLRLAASRPDLQGLAMDPTAHSEFWNIEAFGLGRQ
jgi:peptide/nickel transport system substrate-binding protein